MLPSFHQLSIDAPKKRKTEDVYQFDLQEILGRVHILTGTNRSLQAQYCIKTKYSDVNEKDEGTIIEWVAETFFTGTADNPAPPGRKAAKTRFDKTHPIVDNDLLQLLWILIDDNDTRNIEYSGADEDRHKNKELKRQKLVVLTTGKEGGQVWRGSADHITTADYNRLFLNYARGQWVDPRGISGVSDEEDERQSMLTWNAGSSKIIVSIQRAIRNFDWNGEWDPAVHSILCQTLEEYTTTRLWLLEANVPPEYMQSSLETGLDENPDDNELNARRLIPIDIVEATVNMEDVAVEKKFKEGCVLIDIVRRSISKEMAKMERERKSLNEQLALLRVIASTTPRKLDRLGEIASNSAFANSIYEDFKVLFKITDRNGVDGHVNGRWWRHFDTPAPRSTIGSRPKSGVDAVGEGYAKTKLFLDYFQKQLYNSVGPTLQLAIRDAGFDTMDTIADVELKARFQTARDKMVDEIITARYSKSTGNRVADTTNINNTMKFPGYGSPFNGSGWDAKDFQTDHIVPESWFKRSMLVDLFRYGINDVNNMCRIPAEQNRSKSNKPIFFGPLASGSSDTTSSYYYNSLANNNNSTPYDEGFLARRILYVYLCYGLTGEQQSTQYSGLLALGQVDGSTYYGTQIIADRLIKAARTKPESWELRMNALCFYLFQRHNPLIGRANEILQGSYLELVKRRLAGKTHLPNFCGMVLSMQVAGFPTLQNLVKTNDDDTTAPFTDENEEAEEAQEVEGAQETENEEAEGAQEMEEVEEAQEVEGAQETENEENEEAQEADETQEGAIDMDTDSNRAANRQRLFDNYEMVHPPNLTMDSIYRESLSSTL